MNSIHEKYFLSILGFQKLPFLVHGFGLKQWEEKDFRKEERWKDFNLLFLDQIHSDFICFIDRRSGQYFKGDALVTSLPRLLLIVRTADCLPLLIVDKRQKVIAAVHCGWRGTQKRITERVIKGLKSHYGCEPSSLLAALGPCIRPGCYEVSEDVRGGFKDSGFSSSLFSPHPLKRGKYFFSLRRANRMQLREQGVEEKNIFHLDACPHCDKRFYSFRRDGHKAGRMLNFIGMFFA